MSSFEKRMREIFLHQVQLTKVIPTREFVYWCMENEIHDFNIFTNTKGTLLCFESYESQVLAKLRWF